MIKVSTKTYFKIIHNHYNYNNLIPSNKKKEEGPLDLQKDKGLSLYIESNMIRRNKNTNKSS